MTLLGEWDGTLDGDSPAAALYEVWLHEVIDVTARPHLGDALFARWRGANGSFLQGVLVAGTASSLCTAGEIADCEAAALEALRRALAILDARLGRDPASWRWGELHPLHFHHQLGVTKGLRRKLDVSVPAPGDSFTINVASHGGPEDFTQVWLPSYRQVIDLGDWSRSRWIYAPGQSGAHYRAHYRDLVAPYMAGDSLPMLFGEEARGRATRVRTFRRSTDSNPTPGTR